ncbi:hypothetical protein NXU94_24415 [Bacteroides faecis]|uniref:hypothetical protein n=1 Tax=Bacteroides faecis TaxID=674529 RepID=UPI002165786D|nr:hypothetical protein [Bacteroides faecis]MCS3070114.1 hypothetical protein [Bacteroides faecis]
MLHCLSLAISRIGVLARNPTKELLLMAQVNLLPGVIIICEGNDKEAVQLHGHGWEIQYSSCG